MSLLCDRDRGAAVDRAGTEPVAMETERHATRERDRRDRPAADGPSVEHDQVAAPLRAAPDD